MCAAEEEEEKMREKCSPTGRGESEEESVANEDEEKYKKE